VCPPRRQWLRIFLHFLDLQLLGRHLRCAKPRDARGLRGEGWGGWSGRISLRGCRRRSVQIGVLVVFGGMRIESTIFPPIAAGLSNQRDGEKLLF
jgi:hypothetical protein